MNKIKLHHSPVFATKFRVQGVNTTTKFQVNQANGTVVFNVDTTNSVVSANKISLTNAAESYDDILTANNHFTIQSTYSGANDFVQMHFAAPANKDLTLSLWADGEGSAWSPYLDIKVDRTTGVELDAASYLNIVTSDTIGTAGDSGDYIRIQTTSNVPEITTIGSCDLKLTASSGNILVGNALTITPTADGTSILNVTKADTTSVFNVDTTNGRVGAGTDSPDSAFHIKAGTSGTVGSHPAGQLIIQNPTASVFANAVITGYSSDGDGNINQQLWYLGNPSSGSSDIIYLNRRNSKLMLGTNNITQMTILGNGNVGIGTTSPDHKLQVDGNIVSETDSTDDLGSSSIFWANTYSDVVYLDPNMSIYSSRNDKLTFKVGNNDGFFEWHDHNNVDVMTLSTNLTGAIFDINANITPTSDSSKDLGTSTKYWAETYTDKLFLNSTATLDGATAGLIDVTGAHRWGGDTNYLQVSSTGILTLAGTAKRWLAIRPDLDYTVITAQGKPTQVVVGVFHGYSMPVYNNDNEELFFNVHVPGRWDATSNPIVHLLVALAGAEDVGDNFKFQASWEHLTEEDVIPATSHDVEVEQAVLTGRIAQYSTYELQFTIDYDVDDPDNLADHDDLAFRLRRIDATNPDITNEIIVLDYHVEFQVDKMFDGDAV